MLFQEGKISKPEMPVYRPILSEGASIAGQQMDIFGILFRSSSSYPRVLITCPEDWDRLTSA